MKQKLERRLFAERVSLRAAQDGKGLPTIVGYAAVFNSESSDLGGFTETIMPGAFTRTLADASTKVEANYNHNCDMSQIPLAMFRGGGKGTLSLKEDERGLLCEFQPADTQLGRDLCVSIERGDVDGMSFAFRAVSDQWDELPDGSYKRTIKDADLFDICATPSPAYPATSVGLRAIHLGANDMTAEDYIKLRDAATAGSAEEIQRDIESRARKIAIHAAEF